MRSHVGVGLGIGSYAPFGYYNRGFGYNSYFGNPYGSYNRYRPSKLDLQVQDLPNEYKDRRWSVRQDRSLSRQQRKGWVRNLKYEEEKAIQEARSSYYKNSEQSRY
ncbi:hypothetical protein BUE76_00155 [Cnuella takakiae]|nr:hypothetical protein BUE76_00155 [Cnuella takakiae]